MEELPEELPFRQKLRQFIVEALDFIFRQILLVDLVIFGLVLVSFLISGGYSAVALSERVFWVAMLVMLIGAVVTAATVFAGKSFGVPLIIRRPEEARRLLDRGPEINFEKEKRYNAGVRLWLIGLGCIAISALVESFFA
jgi:hypothetical protein